MTDLEFIEEQVAMFNEGIGESQIKDNVYRYIFRRGIPNFNINALIYQCMGLYAEILIKTIR